MQSKIVLNYLLLFGSIYFFAVSIVHFFGIKFPILFIYFDVNSYAYQDRIISVLSFAFAVFLFSGYKLSKTNLDIVKYILIAGTGAGLGLIINNFLAPEFRSHLIYWFEITALAIYLSVLIIFYLKEKMVLRGAPADIKTMAR